MSKYEDIKRAAAFSKFLETLDEAELKYVAEEMQTTFSKEELVEIDNILNRLDEEVELETLTKEFIQDLKKLFN